MTTQTTQTTPLARFTDGIAAFLNNHILPGVVDYCRANPNTVPTVDQLRAHLQVPAPTPTTPVQGLQMPTIPGFTANAAPVAKPTKSRKPAQQYNGPTCPYVYTKGKNKGSACGAPCAEGSEFCKECVKKTGNTGRGGGTAAGAGAVPGQLVTGFRGYGAGVPPMPTPPLPTAAPGQPAAKEISATPIPGRLGMFKENNHGFILQKVGDNSLVVHGVEKNGPLRTVAEMTPMERQIATQMGLVLHEAAAAPATAAPAPAAPAPAPAMPGLPQLPGMPQLPQLPGMPQLPTNAATAPTPSPMPAPAPPQIPGMPQLPGLPGLPQLPGMPQLPGAR